MVFRRKQFIKFNILETFLGDKIDISTNESVEGDKQDIRQEPFSLPAGFEWDTLDLRDEAQVQTILSSQFLHSDFIIFFV